MGELHPIKVNSDLSPVPSTHARTCKYTWNPMTITDPCSHEIKKHDCNNRNKNCYPIKMIQVNITWEQNGTIVHNDLHTC